MTRNEAMSQALYAMRLGGLKMAYGAVPADAEQVAIQIRIYLAILGESVPNDIILATAHRAVKTRDSYPTANEFADMAQSVHSDQFTLVLHPNLDLCVRVPKGLTPEQITKAVLDAGRKWEEDHGHTKALAAARRKTTLKAIREKVSMPPVSASVTDADLSRRDELIAKLRVERSQSR